MTIAVVNVTAARRCFPRAFMFPPLPMQRVPSSPVGAADARGVDLPTPRERRSSEEERGLVRPHDGLGVFASGGIGRHDLLDRGPDTVCQRLQVREVEAVATRGILAEQRAYLGL